MPRTPSKLTAMLLSLSLSLSLCVCLSIYLIYVCQSVCATIYLSCPSGLLLLLSVSPSVSLRQSDCLCLSILCLSASPIICLSFFFLYNHGLDICLLLVRFSHLMLCLPVCSAIFLSYWAFVISLYMFPSLSVTCLSHFDISKVIKNRVFV